ncbi:MAG: AraC family transcriptional regulator [Clostridia bacterium]
MLESKRVILNHILHDVSPTFAGCNHLQYNTYHNWQKINKVCGFCKFYLIEKGSINLEINGKTICPQKGELYLIPSNVKHTYSKKNKDVSMYWCHFDIDVDIYKVLNYSPSSLVCDVPLEETIEIFKKLKKINKEKSTSAILYQKAYIMELMGVFFGNVKILDDLQTDDFADKINKYIVNNYDKDINLSKMAAVVNLQQNYFINIFKTYFLLPPMKYVNLVRIENAAKCLTLQKEFKIQEIAIQNGFSDYRYFIRAFKKHFGCSPSEYRKIFFEEN